MGFIIAYVLANLNRCKNNKHILHMCLGSYIGRMHDFNFLAFQSKREKWAEPE